jgi:hypothetical protein
MIGLEYDELHVSKGKPRAPLKKKGTGLVWVSLLGQDEPKEGTNWGATRTSNLQIESRELAHCLPCWGCPALSARAWQERPPRLQLASSNRRKGLLDGRSTCVGIGRHCTFKTFQFRSPKKIQGSDQEEKRVRKFTCMQGWVIRRRRIISRIVFHVFNHIF